jgi:hypothetical protein
MFHNETSIHAMVKAETVTYPEGRTKVVFPLDRILLHSLYEAINPEAQTKSLVIEE